MDSKAQALREYFDVLKKLQSERILINKKDFTCQIGEWLIEAIYDGTRATSGIQKGWDVEIKDKRIQVKTHAKAIGNNNRWSPVKDSTGLIDELIIVVFSPDYKLKEFYIVPWEHAQQRIQYRGKKEKRAEINWSSIQDYRVDIDKLPRQDIIQLFS